MDGVFSKWLSELSLKRAELSYKSTGKGAVRAAARIYEAARNALEYRAEHLVRRAAIERILKREMVLAVEPEIIADHLDQELSWADYTGESEEQQNRRGANDSDQRLFCCDRAPAQFGDIQRLAGYG